MDPVIGVLIPGILGGLVLAWLLVKLPRRRPGPVDDPFAGMAATSVINMSQLRVAGVGGLGLVAMAVATALDVPRIGQSLALGLILGAVFAAVLILRRRRTGPMPSSGRHAGANNMLSIDETPAPAETDAPDRGARDRTTRVLSAQALP